MIRQDVLNDKESIISLYVKESKTIKEIALIYKCDYRIISRILIENGISIRLGGYYNKKYCLDEHVFDIIDNEEKAYVLGFLYADGCNIPDIGRISISLAIYDRDILEKIRMVFKSNAPIRIRNATKIVNTPYVGVPSVNLTLHSVYLSQSLKKLGVLHNKTTILKFPSGIPDIFIKDFIRGYFDGDGSITIGKNGIPKISLISTIDFLQGLIEKSVYNNWPSKIYQKAGLNNHLGIVELNSKQDVKNFCDWIYKDAHIFCQRKYERYYSYYIKGEPLHKYSKLSIEQLMEKYGYKDIVPQYDKI